MGFGIMSEALGFCAPPPVCLAFPAAKSIYRSSLPNAFPPDFEPIYRSSMSMTCYPTCRSSGYLEVRDCREPSLCTGGNPPTVPDFCGKRVT